MAHTATEPVAEVLNEQRGQSVLLPEEFHLSKDRVYLKRDPQTGIISISERPFRPSLQEVFDAIEAARGEDFELDRDQSLPVERDLF
jgi:virulence-associated protein VagC